MIPLYGGRTMDELHAEALGMDARIGDALKSWAIVEELRKGQGR